MLSFHLHERSQGSSRSLKHQPRGRCLQFVWIFLCHGSAPSEDPFGFGRPNDRRPNCAFQEQPCVVTPSRLAPGTRTKRFLLFRLAGVTRCTRPCTPFCLGDSSSRVFLRLRCLSSTPSTFSFSLTLQAPLEQPLACSPVCPQYGRQSRPRSQPNPQTQYPLNCSPLPALINPSRSRIRGMRASCISKPKLMLFCPGGVATYWGGETRRHDCRPFAAQGCRWRWGSPPNQNASLLCCMQLVTVSNRPSSRDDSSTPSAPAEQQPSQGAAARA